MAATSTRSPPNAYSFFDADSPQPQRRVSKQSSRSSFLSMKRTKKKSVSSIDSPVPAAVSPMPGQSRVGDESMSPSSFHALQDPAEAILSGISRQGSRTGHHSRRSSRSVGSRQDQVSLHSARSSERQRSKKKVTPSEIDSQPFPIMGGRDPSISDDRYGRRRSQSQRHASSFYPDDFEELVFHNRPFNISLVDSASSVLSQYDAPKTPVDDHLFRDPVYTPVVVAAPVPGVETMDALVDGMNDGFADDHFTGSGGLSGRKKISKSGHHPLYHPPLPKPPPGVILGKAVQTSTPPRSQDSDEDEEKAKMPVRSWSEQREHRKKRRPGSARSPPPTTSSSHPVYPSRPASTLSTRSSRYTSSTLTATDQTIAPRPSSSQSAASAASPPSTSTSTPTNRSFIASDQATPTSRGVSRRPVTADSTTTYSPDAYAPALGDPYALRPTSVLSTSTFDSYQSATPSKTVAPSISEIIRAHAPPAQRTRSRKSSYTRSFGHETVLEQPEPSTQKSKPDANDLVSRSSVDTIAEEVQRTLEKIPPPSPSPRPLHGSRSFPRLPVVQIDTRNVSSSRSDGRRESSIFSYSTTSDQPPIPGFDLSTLTKPPSNSPSQTIAQTVL
ncbi:hypothetical protein DAEQUDRAFT_6347 [Daedalea quercina L-15889]|uniref:Uncharacterized protein n=1 Tax=Daedalea quercina L-15889 TaxID=1314783 RepID=A0A165UE48_9APHY|nr:hypothetical protein DAEQUDRAFT_6347 [Daedalea quercina L-15889]